MDLIQLEESVRNLRAPNYGKVQRTGDSYVATQRWAERLLKICLMLYRRIERLDQTARLLRDTMEFAVRRYHGYNFEYKKQTHYRDSAIPFNQTHGLVIEHVIPVRLLIAGLLQEKLPIGLVLNPPICLLTKASDLVLESEGLGDTTPDVWWFWKRYSVLNNLTIVTNQGEVVDLATWNLGTHCNYFNIKI